MLNEWVKKNRKQGKRKGITLVEVLVVIVILAVLTVSLSAKIGSYFDKPKELRVLNDMSYVRDAVILENGVNGLKSYGTLTANALPAGETAKLVSALNSVLDPSLALKKATATEKIETDAKDPWGVPYQIKLLPGTSTSLSGIEITSYGPNGSYVGTTATDGGAGDNYVMTIGFGVNEGINTVSQGALGVHYGALPGQ